MDLRKLKSVMKFTQLNTLDDAYRPDLFLLAHIATLVDVRIVVIYYSMQINNIGPHYALLHQTAQ